MENARVIGLAGPTASGKSALSLELASHLPIEIISVDSALVYEGMDIGTAKPTPAERAVVPHHLIDIRDPLDTYNAAEFVRDARRLIGEINARGKVALLVGGTMLYFKALTEGLNDLPPADSQVRAALEAEALAQGWPALHAELERVDPVTASRLPAGDTQRIQRALEVWRITGKPLSSFHTQKNKESPLETGLAFPLFSLEPTDRPWLHARIEQRFDAMLAAGFMDEVASLRARGDLSPELPSMRCVGYRQAWEALDTGEPLAQMRERGIAATRQLAKRQITWLRGMSDRKVLNITGQENSRSLALRLLGLL
ncbi:tRNA (adenosine(37)-N6)-dimethylallyltransferase MiaA [Ottowia thiooxydans]|uniref:tRNA (adenosine(37)-N6)-dimethylallyltransferase MiaA n=1 Tax=Ottowia thiooxydans TaxID=219182 RepID=UPI0003FEC736|nr:tRNA (adenosine(37)-N6)-dimethylallyltransferase MiaA [Ottowia thiooxydans]